MINVDGEQTATDSWTTISSMTIDTFPNEEERIVYYFTCTDNDVEARIQCSVNNINWITIPTRDLNGNSQDTILVQANESAIGCITSEMDLGVYSCFQYYRVQIKGESPYGTIECWGDCK